MNCPRCGGPLEEKYARVHQPMPFSGPKRLAQKGRLTMKRPVYVCKNCGKAFIRTLALMETEIIGH